MPNERDCFSLHPCRIMPLPAMSWLLRNANGSTASGVAVGGEGRKESGEGRGKWGREGMTGAGVEFSNGVVAYNITLYVICYNT